jgi:hypothetical protein
MSSDVTSLINALRDGTLSLEQVAQRFRESTWPRRTAPAPSNYLERAAAAQEDSAPFRTGSFDDVVAAHHDGRLTDEEYTVLSAAVAESKRAEDRRREAEAAEPE